jgi:hypothetical protein
MNDEVILKKFIRNKIALFPKIELFLRASKWKINDIIDKIYFKVKKIDNLGDPMHVEWIDLNWLQYRTYAPKNIKDPTNITGVVADGDWDKNINLIADFNIIKSFKSRYLDGIDWTKTPYYSEIFDKIKNGKEPYGMKNLKDLNVFLDNIDELYNDIARNGYKSQDQLTPDVGERKYPRKAHNIVVNIDRNGHYTFNDGRRRLAIAFTLGIEKIPVKVNIRHKEWENFRREILKETSRRKGLVYQPLLHPDLWFFKPKHDDSRFKMMCNDINTSNYVAGSLIDIGSEWGYHCHKFEEIGYKCTAVERNMRPLYFMRKLKTSLNRKFDIIDKSIFDIEGVIEYDVILALNIFHHFIKTPEMHINFIDLLSRLKSSVMYFGPHNTNEPQMRNSYKNYDNKEFVEFIINNSNYTKFKLLGTSSDTRQIYKIW